jgi:hypothetical protein
MAVSKPRAMSCELTCLQSSVLIAQNLSQKIEFHKHKTNADTNIGCEQA